MEDEVGKIATQQMQQLEIDIRLVRSQAEAILQREKQLQREYDAWKTIVESRFGPLDAATETATLKFKVGPESDSTNKTDFVRKVFREAGEHGLTASELVAKVKNAGIDASRSFPYTAISKMKERRELIEQAGRYVWSEYVNQTQESLKMEEATEVAS